MRFGRLRFGVVFTAVGALAAGSAWAQEPEPPPASPPEITAPSPAPNPSPSPLPHLRGANDKRRTLRSYPRNLRYNVLGVVHLGNRYPLLSAVALWGASRPFDDNVVRYFESNPHDQFGKIGQAMGGGLLIGAATLGAFSLGRISPWDRFRASTYDLSQAALINLSYVFVMKEAVRRTRPDGSDRFSFPSGHASNAFATATVLERHYGWKVGVPGYAVATFIASSRLAATKHFLSDVTFGAAFGFGVGRTVVRRNNRPPSPPGEKPPKVPPPKTEPEVMLTPDAGPSHDGVGVRFSIIF